MNYNKGERVNYKKTCQLSKLLLLHVKDSSQEDSLVRSMKEKISFNWCFMLSLFLKLFSELIKGQIASIITVMSLCETRTKCHSGTLRNKKQYVFEQAQVTQLQHLDLLK